MRPSRRSCLLGRELAVVILAVSSGACIWLDVPHMALHPTQQASATAGGVALGVHIPVEETDQDNRVTGFNPYGEGWARLGGLGPGQLELRITPSMGFLSYRFPVLDNGKMPITLDVIPSMGLGFYFFTDLGSDGDYRSVTFGPGLTALVTAMDRKVYVAARGGVLFQHIGTPNLLGGAGSASRDNGIMTFGLNVGYILPFDTFDLSAELGWQRQAYTGVGASMHIVVASVGFNIGPEPPAAAEDDGGDSAAAKPPEAPKAERHQP